MLHFRLILDLQLACVPRISRVNVFDGGAAHTRSEVMGEFSRAESRGEKNTLQLPTDHSPRGSAFI